jgi:hypothetical protein
MSGASDAIKGIRRAAKARAKADVARRKATDELRGYCKAAQEAGIPVTQIASEAGLSRQGVYDLLGDLRAPSDAPADHISQGRRKGVTEK